MRSCIRQLDMPDWPRRRDDGVALPRQRRVTSFACQQAVGKAIKEVSIAHRMRFCNMFDQAESVQPIQRHLAIVAPHSEARVHQIDNLGANKAGLIGTSVVGAVLHFGPVRPRQAIQQGQRLHSQPNRDAQVAGNRELPDHPGYRLAADKARRVCAQLMPAILNDGTGGEVAAQALRTQTHLIAESKRARNYSAQF